MCAAVSVVVDCLAVAVGFLTASRTLHRGALYPLFRAPMSFFDTTPVGRILNYFSTDLDTADSVLPLDVQLWLISITSLLSTVVTIAFAKPVFLAVILPILAVNSIIQVLLQYYKERWRIYGMVTTIRFDFDSTAVRVLIRGHQGDSDVGRSAAAHTHR